MKIIFKFFTYLLIFSPFYAYPAAKYDINRYDHYLEMNTKELILAIQTNVIGNVQAILNRHKVNINWQDDKGFTPLMHSVLTNDEDIVKCILKVPNIRVNLQNHENRTALWIAASNGLFEIKELLLKNGAIDNMTTVSTDSWHAHILDSESAEFEYASYLRSKAKEKSDKEYQEKIIEFFKNGDLKKIKSVNRVNKNLKNAMELATSIGDVNIINYLLDCVEKKSKLLGKTQQQIDELFLDAVLKGDVSRASDLLDVGADLFAQTKDSMTALMLAVLSKSSEMVQFICSIFDDLESVPFIKPKNYFSRQNSEGYTAFMLAAESYPPSIMILENYKKYDDDLAFNKKRHGYILLLRISKIKHYFKVKFRHMGVTELIELLKAEIKKYEDDAAGKQVEPFIFSRGPYIRESSLVEKLAIDQLKEELIKDGKIIFDDYKLDSQFNKDIFFLYSVYNLDMENIKLALELGANPGAKLFGENGIMLLIKRCHEMMNYPEDNFELLPILKFLIDKYPQGINECNANGENPLRLTIAIDDNAIHCNIPFFKYLFSNGADPKSLGGSGKTILMELFNNFNFTQDGTDNDASFSFVDDLIKKSDVNFCHPKYGTALQHALNKWFNDHNDRIILAGFVKSLIKNGADIYARYHFPSGKGIFVTCLDFHRFAPLKQLMLEAYKQYKNELRKYHKELRETVQNIQELQTGLKHGGIDPKGIICRYLMDDKTLVDTFRQDENENETEVVVEKKEEKVNKDIDRIKKRRTEFNFEDKKKYEKSNEVEEGIELNNEEFEGHSLGGSEKEQLAIHTSMPSAIELEPVFDPDSLDKEFKLDPYYGCYFDDHDEEETSDSEKDEGSDSDAKTILLSSGEVDE